MIKESVYGKTPNGEVVHQYHLENKNGVQVGVISFGGRINYFKVPDSNEKLENVVLNLGTLEEYLSEDAYLGAIIGRYGNRIADGKFSLDGKDYKLFANDGKNHLHGGKKGFDKVIWSAEINEDRKLRLSYFSKHMEEGYPGNLQVAVTYELRDDNALHVSYEAVTDVKTVLNLTQHSYFNLSGDFSRQIVDHYVKINADTFLPVDKKMIPIGIFRSVEETPFDFRKEQQVKKTISAKDEQLEIGKGFDHTWVLKADENEIAFAASAWHKKSGRLLEVFTTEPGIQFYTANFLDGTLEQPDGKGVYGPRSGFCFETQHYPNSPNEPKFPSVVLEPEEKYGSKTIFKFSVKN